MKSHPDNAPGEPTKAVAPTGSPEALAWQAGLSDSLPPRLMGGQLPLPKVPRLTEEVC